VIFTLTRTSLRARKGRTFFIGLTIALGVSFVSGAFVLADSLRSTFDSLFRTLNENVDLEVRTKLEVDDPRADRDPVPASLVEILEGVEGVDFVEPLLLRFAQILDAEGKPIDTRGAPTFGTAWDGDASLTGTRLRAGAVPSGPGEVAIDLSTAKRVGFELGSDIEVVGDTGRRTFRLVGFVGIGDEDGFGGASIAAFDTATAQEFFDTAGFFDAIDIAITPGTDVEQVRAAVAAVLPDRLEVVTGEEVAQEASDRAGVFIGAFGTGLLIFAFITAFVAGFIINNVFSISITQRLRELALLRAIGANGGQIRGMILVEALLVSITATIVGVFGGLGVARGLIFTFDTAGTGFPRTALIMQPRTVVFASIVGIGITLASVLVPSQRAARVPPIAAMRPEMGFGALSSGRRFVVGTVVLIVGAVAFGIGLFVRPGGTIGLIALAGGGALVIFLGAASLSATIARPVTSALGWPASRLAGVAGGLARGNAGRVPKRTARAASALMIGVALVSAAAVFASSLRATFVRILDRSVTADFIFTDPSFQGLPPTVAKTLSGLDELAAVSPVRGISALIDNERKSIGAVDPIAFAQLAEIDVVAGSLEALSDGGILVHTDPARDLALSVGDTVTTTFQNGVVEDLTVDGIYDNSALVGNWLTSIATVERVSTLPPRDFFVIARLADGVDPVAGRLVIEEALSDFPQVEVQSNAEFRKTQEGQINQLLAIITSLLGAAIAIAVVGIAITLALSVFERTREIGLLRAVGMSRRQMRRTVRWESVIVSVFGALVGIVIGVPLGVALSIAVPDDIIEQLAFPTSTVVLVFVFAVIAGVVAAWYPARKASRMDILRAIATE
jgi:putative ABC transport system permease protein